jgi:hypothetical protein
MYSVTVQEQSQEQVCRGMDSITELKAIWPISQCTGARLIGLAYGGSQWWTLDQTAAPGRSLRSYEMAATIKGQDASTGALRVGACQTQVCGGHLCSLPCRTTLRGVRGTLGDLTL